MFGIPVFTLIKIGLLLALLAGGAWAIGHYKESLRKEGDVRTEAKLQPKIDAAEKQRDAAEATIKALNERATKLQADYLAEVAARLKLEREKDEQTRLARKALADLAAAVDPASRVDVPRDVARVLDAASAFANGGNAAAGGESGRASIALPGSAATYRGTDLANYFTAGADAFRVADEGWASCVAQYNDARAAQLKGEGNAINAP